MLAQYTLLTWFIFLVHVWEVVKVFIITQELIGQTELLEATKCMQGNSPSSSHRKPYTHQSMGYNEISPGMP